MTKENNLKNRESNIELLRILAMLLIISFHYAFKSGYTYETFTINTFIVKIFYYFGELAVNLFFLISGYFMIKGKFSIKKLICLLLEIEFYYLLNVFIAYKLDIYTFNGIKDYILLFFPFITNQYWFMTVYLLVYIFSPYINKLIENLTREEHKKLIILLLIIWCIIPTIFGIFYNDTEKLLNYSRFIWFIIMYFIGSYLRLYKVEKLEKNSFKIAIISFSIMAMSILFIYKFRAFFRELGLTELAYFWTPNNVLMLLLSISIFQIFLKIKIKPNKIINKIASTTLGIYMLHDGILNPYIWNEIFKTRACLENKYSILYIIGTSFIIFVIGSLIDLIRNFIEKCTIKKLLNYKYFDKIEKI